MAATSSSANAGQPRKLSPLYVFGVTTLAVFLAGVIGYRTPITGYVATGTAVCKVSGDAELTSLQDAISERLRDEASIRQAVRSALAGSRNDAGPPPDKLIAGVRTALKTQVTRGEPGTLHVAVRYTDARLKWAVAMVDGLLAPLQSPQTTSSSASDRTRRQTWWDVVEARHYERKARFELDNFFDEHFAKDEAAPRNETLAESETTATTPPTGAGDANASPTAIELLSRLKELRERRSRLQGEFTPSHPRVREVEVEIEKTEAELAAMDVTDPGPNTPTVPGGEQFTSTNALPSAATTPGWDGLLAKYRVVRQAYRDAVENCKRAETASAAINSPAASATGTFWNIDAARISRRLGGTPNRLQLAGLGGLALVVGLVTSLLLGRSAGPAVFTSPQQVEEALSLPIVGQLSTAEGPLVRSPGRLGRLAGTLVLRASELVVALVFFAVLFFSLRGSTFLRELVDDPLTTLSMLRDRVPEAIRR